MSKVQLKPGDYVLTKGMNEEQYHAVLDAMSEAGCSTWKFPSFQSALDKGIAYIRWDSTHYAMYGTHAIHLPNGRQLTIEQVLGEQEPEQWNGEGLPPVGAVVEHSSAPKWKGVVVTPCDDDGMVVVDIDGKYRLWSANCLRPIRSDREKAVEEMASLLDDVKDAHSSERFGPLTNEAIAKFLYDQGYRKEKSS